MTQQRKETQRRWTRIKYDATRRRELPPHEFVSKWHCRSCQLESYKRRSRRAMEATYAPHEYVSKHHCRDCLHIQEKRWREKKKALGLSHSTRVRRRKEFESGKHLERIEKIVAYFANQWRLNFDQRRELSSEAWLAWLECRRKQEARLQYVATRVKRCASKMQLGFQSRGTQSIEKEPIKLVGLEEWSRNATVSGESRIEAALLLSQIASVCDGTRHERALLWVLRYEDRQGASEAGISKGTFDCQKYALRTFLKCQGLAA